MIVRRLREDEIGTLVDDLWAPFAREMAELDPYNRLADDWRESAFDYRRTLFEDEDVATFVAVAGDSIAGYAVVEYEDSPAVFARGPEASLEEVYVVPARRGEGTASKLMSRAEEWAADHGCERVALSVNAENETSRTLYESRGYGVRRYRMDKELPE